MIARRRCAKTGPQNPQQVFVGANRAKVQRIYFNLGRNDSRVGTRVQEPRLADLPVLQSEVPTQAAASVAVSPGAVALATKNPCTEPAAVWRWVFVAVSLAGDGVAT
jgi:hypothetical protein